MPSENPLSVEKRLGMLIRLLRKQKGMSQKVLGMKLGLTPQQIQKYEKGVNVPSFQRLDEMSKAFDVPVERFLAVFSCSPLNKSHSMDCDPKNISKIKEDTTPFFYGDFSNGRTKNPQTETSNSTVQNRDVEKDLTLAEIEDFFLKFLSLDRQSQRAVCLIVLQISSQKQ